MRCGAAVSDTGQTGQSEDIHSPEECANTVVSLDEASLLVDRGGLNHRYFMLAETLSDQVESCGQGSVTKRLVGLARE